MPRSTWPYKASRGINNEGDASGRREGHESAALDRHRAEADDPDYQQASYGISDRVAKAARVRPDHYLDLVPRARNRKLFSRRFPVRRADRLQLRRLLRRWTARIGRARIGGGPEKDSGLLRLL